MGEGLPGWLTMAEAAERFAVDRARLRRAVVEGRLKGVKIGQGRSQPWLLRTEEVQRFLRESRRGPKPRARLPVE